MMTIIGVLLPLPPDGPPNQPGETTLGQAAQRLAGEGIRVIFGSQLDNGMFRGFAVHKASWVVEETQVRAMYDSWPSYALPTPWADLLQQLDGTPLYNPVSLTYLCGDRLALQRVLETSGVPVTPTEQKGSRFERALDHWKAGYLKPRYRANGRRVQLISATKELPDQRNELILQQSRGSPPGWDGMCVRALAQRQVDGSWVYPQAVAFRSKGDPVAGTAAATVLDTVERALPTPAVATIRHVCEATVDALCDDTHTCEVGIDFAVDRFYQPWIIDVEAKPKWGLVALARKQAGMWNDEIVETHCRPLRYIAMQVRS